MKQYATATDLRRALEARLKQQATAANIDYGRLRRITVFDRIAARLAASGRPWVLKGGTCLEFRLGLRARATKDLDLALRDGPTEGIAVREELIETLGMDADGDHFVFAIGSATSLEPDAAGNPGWRFSVDSSLGGRTFAQVRVDVVLRSDELAATERVTLPGALSFAGIPPRTIESVDRRQHFAEKLHALTRDYGKRPNTRVKDLVDLVLLIEDGLEPDGSLHAVVAHVFATRGTHSVPGQIPDPPPAWVAEYPKVALTGDLAQTELSSALELLRSFWARVPTTGANA